MTRPIQEMLLLFYAKLQYKNQITSLPILYFHDLNKIYLIGLSFILDDFRLKFCVNTRTVLNEQ